VCLMDENGSSDRGGSFWRKLFHYKRRNVTAEDELHDLIEFSERQGLINAEEGEMFSSIIEFGDTIVREEMIPRTKMRCCSVDASLSEIIKIIIRYGHSRIPVYENSIDQIVGLIYAKDLLKYWGKSDAEVSLRDIMRTPYFVPETKRIVELLHEFRSKQVHLAIAIDEYGGTSGLITLEDLIEEIIGDIKDEYDAEENLLVEKPDGSVVVDARLNLCELEDYYHMEEIPRVQFDSVGGLLLYELGRLPTIGETITIHGLKFEVLNSDKRVIRSVRVTKVDQSQADGPAGEAV